MILLPAQYTVSFVYEKIHGLLQHGMTALHFAANAGHAEVVKVLLGASANINAMDEVHCC